MAQKLVVLGASKSYGKKWEVDRVGVAVPGELAYNPCYDKIQPISEDGHIDYLSHVVVRLKKKPVKRQRYIAGLRR